MPEITTTSEPWTAAIHEAGHVVIAALHGASIRGTRIDVDPRTGKYRGLTNLLRMKPEAEPLIGIAGLMAQFLDDTEVLDLDTLREQIRGLDFSFNPLDAELIGETITFEMLDSTVTLLVRNWQAVMDIAGQLVERGTIGGREIYWIVFGK
ncbi:hypothetical protein Mal52_51160 [Symmachiella dynata]|uniref:ATP-dependent zinc metalloprotease FtsH n=1 Tax=Symmachiella dynata TaxID=2527995 RepID=A0A517ZVS6_9PLAN|nr:hypothetical protein [Symmachiella dynata]QDU46594.1 hypothetical protein Mal52_51160 [Symmachiella dynata]